MITAEEIHPNIDPLHIEDLQNPQHPSVFSYSDEGYSVFILRVPKYNPEEEEAQGVSYGFIITGKDAYYYNARKEGFVQLSNGLESLYRLVDEKVDDIIQHLFDAQSAIMDMEERMYENDTSEFKDNWLTYRSMMLICERIFQRGVYALEKFTESFKYKKDFPSESFRDLHEHFTRGERTAVYSMKKLDDLMSIYTNLTAERTNRTVFLLTVISAIFLPLNLIVGFFGMNTGGMPYAESPAGTLSAVKIMLFTTVVLLVLIAVLKYIEIRRDR